MILPAKLRAPLLGAAIAVTVGVVLWTESWTWRHITEVRDRANAVDSERFHRATQLEANFRELNDAVFRYSLAPTAAARPVIDQRKSRMMINFARTLGGALSANESAILDRGRSQLAAYLDHIAPFLDPRGARPEAGPWRERKEQIVAELLSTLVELAGAERAELTAHLAQAQTGAEALHRQFILSSLALLLMGGALAALVYRGVVMPLQDRLRQSQRVIERQEKLSSLGVLAAGVAHEIRNPLTSIKVRLFTQQQLLKQGSEESEDNVFLTGEISRLEKIVNDFLAFARPSNPEFVVIKATAPMRALLPLLQPSLRGTKVQIKEEFMADPHIRADAGQLKQVLINLVKNAAEAMPNGGTVTLRTRTERRGRGARADNVAVIEVADTGPGIPPDIAKRLFDPFFTTKASGTGLGLSIAARIIEKHGGTLEYSTAPKLGTTFRIVLPAEHS